MKAHRKVNSNKYPVLNSLMEFLLLRFCYQYPYHVFARLFA